MLRFLWVFCATTPRLELARLGRLSPTPSPHLHCVRRHGRYFIRVVSAPMSIGNATVAPTAGASSQVTYEFSLTQITATSINARSVRNFDQVLLVGSWFYYLLYFAR